MEQFPPEKLFIKLGFNDNQKVQEELKSFFGFLNKEQGIERWRNIYEKFCEILEKTKSVIYGEFILNAVSEITEKDGKPYKPFSLDIFATYSGAVAINDFIKTHMSRIFYGSGQSINIVKPYKHSIQRNNKVLSQIIYIMNINGRRMCINIVDDDPSHVVSREELSFLQILFDGEHVKATNIEDVKTRIGTLKKEYLPLVDWDELEKEEDENYEECARLSISRYNGTNFTINYNKSSELIGYGYLYGTEVSEEEHLVLYLYNNLVHNLVNYVFKEMMKVTYIVNEDITCADIYLRWFYLEKPTMKHFMKIIRKIVRNGKFLLPLLIKGIYKEDSDIEVALLIDSCSLYYYFGHYMYSHKKDNTKATEFAMQVIEGLADLPDRMAIIKRISQKYFENTEIYALVRIIKKIMLKKYLVLPASDQYKYDYKKDYDIMVILLTHINLFYNYFDGNKYSENESETFKQFALTFIQSIGFESEEELKNAHVKHYTLRLDIKISNDEEKTKTFKNYLEIAKYEKYMTEKEDKEKSKPNTRNISALNIVRPSRIHLVDYDEKSRMVGQKCINASNFSLYDINAYLKGKPVRGYTKNGEKSPETNLPPVNPKDAMKRLIFFLATSEKLDKMTPFCYNLDLLTKDIGSLLYVECEDIDNRDGLNYLFGQNPIINLNFGFSIYVLLSEILDAIYNTKNQVFVLIPTDKVFKYTASMAIQFGTAESSLGGHHCQEGSNKQLHSIKVCKGSKENTCWPVNEAIELNEVYPSTYFMKQKFYIWSKSENSMDGQFNISNQSYIDKVRREREYEMHRGRVERGDSLDSQDSPDTLRQMSNLTFGTDSDDEESLAPPDVQRQLLDVFGTDSDDEESLTPPTEDQQNIPRTPMPNLTFGTDSDDEESLAPPDDQQNIPRTQEEIRAYLTGRFPSDEEFRRLIDIVVDIVSLLRDVSYNEADRIFTEVLGYE